METIRNYLESMFASLPNTPEVQKARNELLQMMEDKYDELTASGISENEAVGTVISEFGNLDELADDLGIRDNMAGAKEEGEKKGQLVTKEEADRFIKSCAHLGLLRSIGIALCIISVSMPLIGDALRGYDSVETTLSRVFVAGMFVLLAAGVALIAASAMGGAKWSYLKEKPCYLEYATYNYVKNEKERATASHIAMKAIGIMLCILCFVPSMLLNGGTATSHGFDMGNFGNALLFFVVGAGVLLIVLSNSLQGSYVRLLNLNNGNTMRGSYSSGNKHQSCRYENKTVAFIMSVYHPTVLCLYLIWSFLTFKWYMTWIIWPVAWIIRKVVEVNLGTKEGE
ncbi:MAG: permease prefix domain 1-containing protein [Lachnospiraceae bacterium]|nr:permease prefix domain 1-containing protein [Lachnospiraceae bacterium]